MDGEIMREAVVETRGAGDAREPGDVVVRWRRSWERSVAEAEGDDERSLAARRRDYGSYLFVAIDLVLTIVVVIALSIPLVLVATAVYLRTGHNLTTHADQLAYQTWVQAPQFNTVALLLTDAGILLVLWYRLRRLRLRWSTFGLGSGLRERPGRAVLVGLLVGVAALILSSIATLALQRLGADVRGQDRALIEPLKKAPGWAVLLFVLAGTFVAPVVEEVLFRGYVFRALAARRSVPLAYLISAGTFAAVHLGEGRSVKELLPLVPPLFVVGLLLCFAYHRTGNLLADITAHVLNNGVAFFLSLVLHQQ